MALVFLVFGVLFVELGLYMYLIMNFVMAGLQIFGLKNVISNNSGANAAY